MITFYRPYSTNIQRNAGYFSLFCLVFVIAVAAIQNTALSDISKKIIIEPYFVVGHLFVLMAIVVCILLGIFLGKKGYISYPAQALARTEVEQYNQKYDADFPLPKSTFLPAFGIIVATIVWPVIYFSVVFLWVPEDLNPNVLKMMHGGFFVVLFYLFYRTVSKQRQVGNMKMTEVFEHAAKKIQDTKLELKNDHFGYSLSRMEVAMGLEIQGQFKGNDFIISDSVKATRYWASSSAEMKGGIHMKLSQKIPFNFTVSENEKLLNKFQGITLDDAFKQRFKLKGIEVDRLSDAFKERLLRSPRSVFLQFSEHGISHELANIYIPPFFTGQGVVLFLDFMLELINDLKEKNK